jgi:GMP synthase-like glutamine amidotransferase
MTVKKEIEAAAIEHIKCPSCGAEPTYPCRKTFKGHPDRMIRPATKTHQRRMSAFMSSEHCRFSDNRMEYGGEVQPGCQFHPDARNQHCPDCLRRAPAA